jgi:hypothetical protein
LLRHSKFGSLTGFSRCKSRGGGYHFSHGRPLKCPVERVHTSFTRVKFKETASVVITNAETEYEILKFSAYYETAKFTGDQSE